MPEKRKFVRIPVNWIVKMKTLYFTTKEDTVQEQSQQGVARDVSLGGVFIESSIPYSVGTVLEIEMSIPDKGRVKLQGIVRWSNDGSMPNKPVGMGIEFLKATIKADETVSVFIEEKLEDRLKEVLLKSDLHKNILKYYQVGKIYKISALAQFVSSNTEDVNNVLNDFKQIGLVEIIKDSVIFSEPSDVKIKRLLRMALSKIRG